MNRNINMNGGQYQLAEKLKDRFSGRGASISGMQASSTRELMDRAQRGYDPSVNCSELAFRENIRARNASSNGVQQSGARNQQYRGAAPDNAAYGNIRSGSSSAHIGRESNSDYRRDMGGAWKSYQSGGSRYSGADKPGGTHGRSDHENVDGAPKKAGAKKKKPGRAAKSEPIPETETIQEIRETKPERRRLTPMFTVCLLLGTMMLMGIVLSFSEIYQTSSEIAQLENQLDELNDTASELKLKLEEKNDIRVIERIATEELGMVKEDSVQRKYLSLSDGERIDIIENGDDDEAAVGTTGVLLSSILSSLDNLFDYFR